ncbi:MAG TPA: cell division protein FtsX [Flavobacteriales bacterium]|nr:cell division protein FtsX [Flavobacteriales bacterium]HCA82900.1 cell division protein FtsX [Flavobacteriales bacterium]HRE73705.1 permease-like cell division protein FtsX [Flavobacteriales bacterium]HRE96373.1 permease-like cell division protein FtsX [Flavobacteriales bacterium]HRJ34731.1 permease-like cell division protein FtsX [Flavobacteriales bacterium]
MSQESNRLARRSTRASYISTVIGISLVLFMLGLVGWGVMISRKVTRLAKESIRMDVFFKENVRDADMRQLEKTLASEDWVKSARFVSKEEALSITESILHDDSLTAPVDNYNAILPSIEVYINEEWAQSDSVIKIEDALLAKYKTTLIEEVWYDRSMFLTINNSTKYAAWIILALAGLLLVVAIALINNTIRLAIYAKRLLIRSMQLVGATESFIRRPFLFRAFVQGILSSLISLGLLLLGMNYLITWFPDLTEVHDTPMMLMLFGGITVLGILISWISTYFALRKYLRLKSELLY